MANKQGHFVVAEGVENKEQYEYLLKNNCDFIQGYYIGKPLDEKGVINLLNNN